MSLGWVIAGTVGQIILGYFLFIYVVFSSISISNSGGLSKLQANVLTVSFYALPVICILSAGMVLYLYINQGSSSAAYWWYATPLGAAALYTLLMNG
jgi:hypothetical protein